MPEERKHVVSRREPITVVVTGDDGEEISFKAREIPLWRARNDLANEVVHQYTAAMNGWLHTAQTTDESVVLQGDAFESLIDYDRLFLMGFGSYESYTPQEKTITPPPAELLQAFDRLDFTGMIAVLSAVLEVNGLEQQVYMIDRSKKGPSPSQDPVSTSDDDGQKMEFLHASG